MFGPARATWSKIEAVRRLALMAALALVGGALVVSACEDDSLYKSGPSTFQNDTVDGAAGAPGAAGAGGTAAATDAGP